MNLFVPVFVIGNCGYFAVRRVGCCRRCCCGDERERAAAAGGVATLGNARRCALVREVGVHTETPTLLGVMGEDAGKRTPRASHAST